MAMSLVQFQVRGGSTTEVEKQIGGNRVNIHGAFTEAESGTNMFDRYSIRKELIPYLLYIHKTLHRPHSQPKSRSQLICDTVTGLTAKWYKIGSQCATDITATIAYCSLQNRCPSFALHPRLFSVFLETR
jgi:hypothetical protein